MSKRSEEILHQIRYTSGKQAHEICSISCVFCVLQIKSLTEVSKLSILISEQKYWQYQVLNRTQSKGPLMQYRRICKIVWNKILCLHKEGYKNFCISFIHNIPTLQTTQTHLKWGIDKLHIHISHNGISLKDENDHWYMEWHNWISCPLC